MYAPHTVSLICFCHGEPRLSALRGVMLQASTGRSTLRHGDTEENDAVLYIPDFTGFLPPHEYAACPDPENHWTLQAEGESAARCGFFVRGELSEPLSLAEARKRYDDVYIIAGYRVHDYGSENMRHIEVMSRVSSRYFYQP